MDQNRSRFDRFMPQSTFGVTFLTIAIIIIIAGFFARGIQPGDQSPEGYIDMAERQQHSLDDLLPLDSNALNGNELVKGTKPANRIKLWGHYGDNRADTESVVAPGYVASLVRTSDCHWSDDAEAPLVGAQLRVGQTLDLASGLVEIAFACGAKAIIEGPAILELHSEKSGALRLGKMTADVPDDVEGFTVTTPTAQLVSISKAERESVAKLTETVDCFWENDSAATAKGAFLKPGSKLKLIGGLAEIKFACGAKVILQGPANLEIESTKTAILHSGKITADVPDELEGFKIRTPVAEITSLPTIPPSQADQQPIEENGEKQAPEQEDAPKAGESEQSEPPAAEPAAPAPAAPAPAAPDGE